MMLSGISNTTANNKINFRNARISSRPTDINSSGEDNYISQRKSVLKQISAYLNSVGISTKIDKNYLEITNLNKLPIEATQITDYILQYASKIKGSVDFGKIGATNLGQVETLEGDLRSGRKFDFSTSDISSLANLKKIDGYMIINRQQLDNMDFTDLEITGDILVSGISNPNSFIGYRRLDNFEKKALLGGFKILT